MEEEEEESILAMMRYGPDRVLCTNDFASALGLITRCRIPMR